MEQQVTVKPAYLEGLANKQDEAAGRIGSATKATDGIGKKVWVSHGLVCAPTNEAVKDAEAARRRAGQAMRAVSTDLAVKLRKAAEKYKGSDLAAASNLDNQIR